MTTNKHSFIFYVFLMLMTIIITGCTASPLSEREMKNDISSNKESLLYESKVSEFEILKRQTNKEDKYDKSTCRVVIDKGNFDSIEYYEIEYEYYDKGGWILNSILPSMKSDWLTEVKEPIDLDSIVNLIDGINITAEYSQIPQSDYCGVIQTTVSSNSIVSIEITSQSTDLKNKTDIVKIRFQVENSLMKIIGVNTLKFEFVGETWALVEYNMEKDNYAKYNYNTENFIEFDIDSIEKLLVDHEANFNENYFEIANLNIIDITNISSGEIFKIEVEYDYIQTFSTRRIHETFNYTFSNGKWEFGTIFIQSNNISALNILGVWNGMSESKNTNIVVYVNSIEGNNVNLDLKVIHLKNGIIRDQEVYNDLIGEFDIDNFKLKLDTGYSASKDWYYGYIVFNEHDITVSGRIGNPGDYHSPYVFTRM